MLEPVGGVLFIYQTSAATCYNGSVDDLFFVLACLAFAPASFAHRKEL